MDTSILLILFSSLLSNDNSCENIYSAQSEEFKICEEICKELKSLQTEKENIQEYIKEQNEEASNIALTYMKNTIDTLKKEDKIALKKVLDEIEDIKRELSTALDMS